MGFYASGQRAMQAARIHSRTILVRTGLNLKGEKLRQHPGQDGRAMYSGADRAQSSKSCVVKSPIGRDDAAVSFQRAAVGEIERAAVEVGDLPACFRYDERPGSLIPNL